MMNKPPTTTNAPHLAPVKSDSDTLEFDPWEKVLIALLEQKQDIKDIKRQVHSLNANVELIRQAYLDNTKRLSILEDESSRRNGKLAVASAIPQDSSAPLDCSDSDS